MAEEGEGEVHNVHGEENSIGGRGRGGDRNRGGGKGRGKQDSSEYPIID